MKADVIGLSACFRESAEFTEGFSASREQERVLRGVGKMAVKQVIRPSTSFDEWTDWMPCLISAVGSVLPMNTRFSCMACNTVLG